MDAGNFSCPSPFLALNRPSVGATGYVPYVFAGFAPERGSLAVAVTRTEFVSVCKNILHNNISFT